MVRSTTHDKLMLVRGRADVSHQQEVVVFRLCPQILEDRLLPVPLHMVPVLNHSMTNRVMHAVSRRLRVRQCFIADEKVEIFDSTFGRQVAGFTGDLGTCAGRLGCLATSSYRGRENAAMQGVIDVSDSSCNDARRPCCARYDPH